MPPVCMCITLFGRGYIVGSRTNITMSSTTGALPRRPLGKTGLNVSVIGFGASPLGGVFKVSLCDLAPLAYCSSTSYHVSAFLLACTRQCWRPRGLTPAFVLQNINEDAGVQAVQEAFKLGINLFDTSPFYGDTKSEQASLKVSAQISCRK